MPPHTSRSSRSEYAEVCLLPAAVMTVFKIFEILSASHFPDGKSLSSFICYRLAVASESSELPSLLFFYYHTSANSSFTLFIYLLPFCAITYGNVIT